MTALVNLRISHTTGVVFIMEQDEEFKGWSEDGVRGTWFCRVCGPLTILWLSPTQMGSQCKLGSHLTPLPHTLMYSFTSVTDRWLVLQAGCGKEESCFHDEIADFYSDFYSCSETDAPWDIWRTGDANKLMSYQIPTKTTK